MSRKREMQIIIIIIQQQQQKEEEEETAKILQIPHGDIIVAGVKRA